MRGLVVARGNKPSSASLTAAAREDRNALSSKGGFVFRCGLADNGGMLRSIRKWGGPAQVDFRQLLDCVHRRDRYCLRLDLETPLMKSLNAELTRKALEKVGNPNILVNLISRRVRQLTSGGGATSRPLVADVGNLGAADIALLEIIEEKMGFDMPEVVELTRPVAKKRKKH